jgi:hypothetical protein
MDLLDRVVLAAGLVGKDWEVYRKEAGRALFRIDICNPPTHGPSRGARRSEIVPGDNRQGGARLGCRQFQQGNIIEEDPFKSGGKIRMNGHVDYADPLRRGGGLKVMDPDKHLYRLRLYRCMKKRINHAVSRGENPVGIDQRAAAALFLKIIRRKNWIREDKGHHPGKGSDWSLHTSHNVRDPVFASVTGRISGGSTGREGGGLRSALITSLSGSSFDLSGQ